MPTFIACKYNRLTVPQYAQQVGYMENKIPFIFTSSGAMCVHGVRTVVVGQSEEQQETVDNSASSKIKGTTEQTERDRQEEEEGKTSR